MATKKVLACSHSRSLQLPARLDARTEFEILERGEAGRATGCTHPHSDHMKFEQRYEAAESMIKVLSVARANFEYLLVNLSGYHVPHSACGS